MGENLLIVLYIIVYFITSYIAFAFIIKDIKEDDAEYFFPVYALGAFMWPLMLIGFIMVYPMILICQLPTSRRLVGLS